MVRPLGRHYVAFSGGLDSTVLLGWVRHHYGRAAPVFFDYGQKHAQKEYSAALNIARLGHVNLRRVYIPFYVMHVEDSVSTVLGSKASGASPIVPGRNLIILAMLASLAQAEGGGTIYIGSNKTDWKDGAFPDCSPGFLEAAGAAIEVGSGNKVFLRTPFAELEKKEIIQIAQDERLWAPLYLTWTCYEGNETPCMVCPSCLERAKAFRSLGIKDPYFMKEAEREQQRHDQEHQSGNG